MRESWHVAYLCAFHRTKEEYMANKDGTTLNHFYEKLFFLKDNMRTATGRAMAEARHQVMVAFVQQLLQEQAGLA